MAMAGQPAEAWLRPVAGDALHLVCGASGSLWRQPNVLGCRCCLRRQGMVKDLAPTGDAEETILAEEMVDTDEITVTMKITAAKQVQYALLAADGIAVPLGGAQPVAKATWTGARLALYARGGTKGDAACIKQLNITV